MTSKYVTLHGHNIIGSKLSAESAIDFTSEAGIGSFFEATTGEVDSAVSLAAEAWAHYRLVDASARANFLRRIADELLAAGDDLIDMAHAETYIPVPRLISERTRTVTQLMLFAELLREGSWVDATIETALPEREPNRKPDLRRMLIPLGPVGVFGASNFPFAYSTAGGDTASALAAGCSVIYKAHPAHPGTSELTASAILRAITATGMPNGTFSMIHGRTDVGISLVQHPKLAAVGFTGSLAAGRSLFNIASERTTPIPVYAEMGSVNPVFLLPDALCRHGEKIASGYVESLTLGMGQFCTNPGVVVGIAGDEYDEFIDRVAALAATVVPDAMLTTGIADAYRRGVERLTHNDTVTAKTDRPDNGLDAAVFVTTARAFISDPSLADEVFGPSCVIVECKNPDELLDVASAIPGQLTATVHATPDDIAKFSAIIHKLETKAGRLVFNGFPTGVEVCASIQHGGPYPASTDSRSTSVGPAAINRFVRPVCWQNAPSELLPLELQDSNTGNIWRRINGHLTQDDVRKP